jgi:hypothetical protein
MGGWIILLHTQARACELAQVERVAFGRYPTKSVGKKGAPTRPKQAGPTTSFTALAY